MELKDVILSTLAEMEDPKEVEAVNNKIQEKKELAIEKVEMKARVEKDDTLPNKEMLYLNSIRERLLVLFEGFQAPNNTNIEAKVDMTLNFLEYTLATIDSRVEELKREEKK